VNGAGSDALVSYAGAVEAIFEAHTLNDSENEVDYFSDAVQKNDATALPKVAAIGSYYSALAPDLMQGQVPAEAQYAHLEMANSLARLGTDVTDMSTMNTDPLRAYLGLEAYQTDIASLSQSFGDMSKVFVNDRTTIQEGDLGYFFYHAFSTKSITTPSQ
jgi:hypothetical protein